MSKCIDKQFEQMLYPFELSLLDESKSHEIEIHLYECEHCFERVQRFKAAAEMLIHDQDIHDELKTQSEQDSVAKFKDAPKVIPISPGFKQRVLTRYLLAAALVLVVGIPLYRFSSPGEIQLINLTPMRGAEAEMISLERGGTAEIHIAVELLQTGGAFSLVIHNVDGDTVYTDWRFTGFDSTGAGLLKLPVEAFKPGYQMLTISDPTGTYLETRVQYLFKVEKATH